MWKLNWRNKEKSRRKNKKKSKNKKNRSKNQSKMNNLTKKMIMSNYFKRKKWNSCLNNKRHIKENKMNNS